MKSVTLSTLRELKSRGEKFTCLTSYDATFTHLMGKAGIETILVGDSLGMVVQGHDSTLPVTIGDMAYHTAAVARGNQGALIIADMPFMSCVREEDALAGAHSLMQAGAHMVKLEGGVWLKDTILQLARGGIPSCVHMGLTPQSVNVLGGYKVQGRGEAADRLLAEAIELDQAGAALFVLECVPTELGRRITKAVSAPVIGIGAGPDCDGQVLVMHDMLGLHPGKPARFVKDFLAESDDGTIAGAFRAYVKAVKAGIYPAPEHCFE
ncbi:MAG TPA: 3-methyl-2-oxobutanoate hydroxymethyltransferase [Moraxellaceae bacterium]|nr:3-methyl-2-oxobutanoate hydroxymethyltransferase [Moraxellaceae bacterium]